MAHLKPSPAGGFTFAEHPGISAPEARIIWRAELDPGTIDGEIIASGAFGSDQVDPKQLARWLTVVRGPDGVDHALLSDGWHHIRLDIAGGALDAGHPVLLRYRLDGLRSAEPKLLSLRRFIDLCRHRRFGRSLYPVDRRIDRGLVVLRVHDALLSGAGHRDIARMLWGETNVQANWNPAFDSLRSRVRRLVAEARRMTAGGYRWLMRDQPPGAPEVGRNDIR